ncbi:pirin family protein [Shewanella cyperi]|uniref:pirin family protein n=1 Tax=Shewanella cyperi TaxID=2814292 RepID=UPI001A93D887|nr:pirin family protein [Shewanella cyperi]QSX40795.1 pirin family protein [Shewanella cyperi]
MSERQSPQFYGGPRECPSNEGRRQIQRILPRISDVGGIPVARAIPQKDRRLIGPWCFLDHIGPVTDGPALDVGPHPHIGLQTFTWMLEGEILHRDSLGSAQVISPGQVNLMTAGYGIAHTEEAVPGHRRVHAAQLWIALPLAHKDTQPRFDHYPSLPRWTEVGVEFTLLTGQWLEHQAPVLHFSPILGMDLYLPATAETPVSLSLPLQPGFEYGLMPMEGQFSVDDEAFSDNQLAYLGLGRDCVELELQPGCRLLLLGGEPLSDAVSIWWNFVGHSKEEIAEAQAQWLAEDPRFGTVPGYRGKRLVPPPLPW